MKQGTPTIRMPLLLFCNNAQNLMHYVQKDKKYVYLLLVNHVLVFLCFSLPL